MDSLHDGKSRRDWWPLVIFGALALWVMSPLLGRWNTHLYGEIGDNVIYVYMAGWMAHAVGHFQSPFFDPHLNTPDGLMLTATDVPYTHLLLSAPLSSSWGAIASYNIIMLVCHFLAGLVPYLWIRQLTGSRFAATMAGVAFMMTPYRFVHSGGHLNLVATHVLPLFFWTLDSTLRPLLNDERLSRRGLLLLALVSFYVGSTSQYYLAICAFTGIVYAILLLWPLRARLGQSWQALAAMLCGGMFSSLPYLSLVRSNTFQHSRIEDSRPYSASPLDFFSPSSSHPLWKLSPAPPYLDSEQTIYIGLVALLLALWGLRQMRGEATAPRKVLLSGQRRAWIGVALFAVVMALGTDLQIAGREMNPQFPLYLPAYFIGQLPFAGIMRVWARFGLITILFVSLLAGVGAGLMAQLMVQRVAATKRRAFMAACALLLLLDSWPLFPPASAVALRPADQWLAQQPGNFAAAFLPPSREVGPIFQGMYGSLWHRKQLPATAHPKHQPPAYRRFRRAAHRFPAAASLDALQQMGFRYLILDTALFDGVNAEAWPRVEPQIARNERLRVVERTGDFVIVGFKSPHINK